MTTRFTQILGLTLMLSVASTQAADLALNRHFSDNMVLQCKKPVTITGSADVGAEVAVSFAGQQKTAKADDAGVWRVTLDPIPANSKGRKLTAASKGKSVALENVVVGDVILVARQTSIDITLGRDDTGRSVAAAHKKSPMFRAITIHTIPAAKPLSDLVAEATDGWAEVDEATALKMTASAYYLGRDLVKDVDVTVGIIDVNLGSAFPLSWLSREALEETEKFYGDTEVMGQVNWHDKALAAEEQGEPLPKQKVPPTNTVKRTLFPSGGYNAVLNPLKHTALKAAVVQLGNDYPYMLYQEQLDSEAPFDRAGLNTAYVETYNIRKVGFRTESKTAPRIVREWRKYLGEDSLPFGLIVPPGSDLHTLGEHHREMRELQRLAAEEDAHAGIILPGAGNIPFSAQPADEELLAKRCLSWIQGAVYNKADTPASGPLFDRMDAQFNEATIYFKEGTADGLTASGDALDSFEAAGVEGEYQPVKATIEGDTIRLKSDDVPRIVRVRYNWSERPNEGLVNAAGLPAVPFRTERAEYHWFVTNSDDDLPEEYHTPANEWEKNDVTLINAQLKTHGYGNFTGWIGPAGFRTGPFGPNMGVREVKEGSPAFGKLLVGDVIYSANGNMLGDKAWEVIGGAITESETREAEGKLVLGVRRDTKNMDVELTLDVMGTYSPTAPFDCPKTEKIISGLEQWVVDHGAGAGFLNSDALFMLASGDPEMQGYVRRIIYNDIMAKRDPHVPVDPMKAGKSWHNSAEAILLGEYYHATGDKHVLPYLKHVCDRLAATQNKEYGGWRHNYPGGATYGLIPNAGLPGVIGMQLAKVAGIDINQEEFARSIHHYSEGKAETGFLIYGYGECQRMVPTPLDPESFYTGHQDTFNGGLSAAGILMGLTGNYRAAHLCSLKSAYAWNNTFGGHGGNFWNNFWTPLGANQHSKPAFIHFWQNYRWYRECNRMFDGSLIQHENGKTGAGCGVALVAPRRRIQVVGAPPSPFATDAPEALTPAREAYWQKEYAEAQKQVEELIAGGTVGKDDMPTVAYFAQQTRDIQASISDDISLMKELAANGDPDKARSFLPGLKGILPDNDPRLAEVEKAIAAGKQSASGQARVATESAEDVEDADAAAKKAEEAAAAAETARLAAAAKRDWVRLVTERFEADGKPKKNAGPAVTSRPDKPSQWKIQVVESMAQAPEGWTEPKFDDSSWQETELPVSWRMYHTALLRTTFNVEDKKAFDALRLYAWVFRQQGIEIHLNGELIGKINNIENKTGDITNDLKESALKHLKNGENILAISTRHNWRWGMLSMSVYNDGFDFNLDARLAEPE